MVSAFQMIQARNIQKEMKECKDHLDMVCFTNKVYGSSATCNGNYNILQADIGTGDEESLVEALNLSIQEAVALQTKEFQSIMKKYS